ncbi:hypothetical protein ACFUGD_01170 [Streptomyces sp. NPDC057217]
MSPDVDWASVAGFLVAPKWDTCPTALAYMDAAQVFGLPIEHL